MPRSIIKEESRVSAPIYYIKDGYLGFGDKTLLAKAELYIKREDRVCLIGRNGCGKSSLMKVINGQYELDGGKHYMEPGTKVGYLQQDIKNTYDGTILSFVMEHIAPEEQYKADMVLEELQISGDLEMHNLSGGQFRRACLARALVEEPDILLLDEPTNHLDIELIEWLENYIRSYPGAVICISHDRAFLNNITNKIWWLDRTNLRKSDKGFKHFEDWQETVLQIEEAELLKLSKKMDTENVWLSQGVTARRKRNQRRLGQLHHLWEQLRSKRTMMTSATRKMDPFAMENAKKTTFIIEMEHVSFGHSSKRHCEEGETRRGNLIINDFSFKVEKGEKIGIIGPNGSGKSTLVKLMVGELKQTDGKIRRGSNLDISYFDQSRSDINPTFTIKRTLCPNGGDYVQLPDNKEMHVASYLRQFMFDPRELDTKVSTLSGGEANRLLLAKTLTKPRNLLIMDEPTNDLDMDSLEILLEVLSDYNGTAIIVSHDRDFLERLVTRTLVFSKDGTIDDIVGGYDDWMKESGGKKKIVKKSATTSLSTVTPAKAGGQSLDYLDPRLRGDDNLGTRCDVKKLTFKDQHLLDTLPKQIDALEMRNKEIEEILSDHTLYSKNPEKFSKLSLELADNQHKISQNIEIWMSIEEKK